jgi:hypothetical protein
MKKIQYLALLLMAITLTSCINMVGTFFKLGFKMGIWSIFILIGLLIWVISKRGKRR